MRSPHNAFRNLLSPETESPGRHRRSEPFSGRHRRFDPRNTSRRARGSAAAVLLLVLAAAPASVAERPANDSTVTGEPGDLLAAREEAVGLPSRSLDRGADPTRAAPEPHAAAPSKQPPPPPEEPKEEPAPEPEPEPEPAAEEKPAEPEPDPGPPAPIGGLTERQMEHAATIVRVGKEMGLPEQAYVVAIATVLQESYLEVYASPVYPESYNYPHDAEGADHDSVGLFQQRPSMGWGTVAECMDPETSSRIFYEALLQVPGWLDLPITVAAQTVQVSAFPDYYAQHEPLARELVAVLG